MFALRDAAYDVGLTLHVGQPYVLSNADTVSFAISFACAWVGRASDKHDTRAKTKTNVLYTVSICIGNFEASVRDTERKHAREDKLHPPC